MEALLLDLDRLIRHGGSWDAHRGQWIPFQWPPGPPHTAKLWAEQIAKNLLAPNGAPYPLTSMARILFRIYFAGDRILFLMRKDVA